MSSSRITTIQKVMVLAFPVFSLCSCASARAPAMGPADETQCPSCEHEEERTLSSGPDGTCDWDDDCSEGQFCIMGKCKYPGPTPSCTSFTECYFPLACVDGVCSECEIATTSSTVGDPCCDDGNCTGGLYCILEQCRPLGGPGNPCGVDQDCDKTSCISGRCQ